MKKPLVLLGADYVPCPQNVEFSVGPCRHYQTADGVKESFAVDRMARAKRFTESELAADMFRSLWIVALAKSDRAMFKPGAQQRASIEATTLQRFATLPHYDEGVAS